MRKLALGAAFALALSAFPLAAAVTTVSTAGAVDATSAEVHVVNALGTSPQNEATTGNDADVTIDCAGGQAATIPVVDPGGADASAGSHTFTIPGTNTCQVKAQSFSDTPKAPPASGSVHTDFDCSSPGGGPNQWNFQAGHSYKVVIEPVHSTLPVTDATIATTVPVALTGCDLKLWEDDVSILPAGQARFTMRQAACNTGRNFHIISVAANGNEIMSGIDPCSEKTVNLNQGTYDFTLQVKLDVNGDGDFGEKWTVFAPNPNGCDEASSGTAGTHFSPDGCPTIDESSIVNIDLGNISLAHGQSFAFNFVDNGSGDFVPVVYGGGDFQDPIPVANWGGAPCDQRLFGTNPIVAAGFGITLLSVPSAPECVGTPDDYFGGVGVIAGPATVQVAFDGNEFTNNPALQTFCTDIITKFQSTVKAETDYVATLTVVNKVDQTLASLVNATDALIAELKATAPAAILPAVETLTDGLNQLNQGFIAVNFNTFVLGQDNLTKIQDGLANPPDNPAVTQATADLTAFVTGNCFGTPGGGATPAEAVNAAAKFTG